jgi:hypothetical protein
MKAYGQYRRVSRAAEAATCRVRSRPEERHSVWPGTKRLRREPPRARQMVELNGEALGIDFAGGHHPHIPPSCPLHVHSGERTRSIPHADDLSGGDVSLDLRLPDRTGDCGEQEAAHRGNHDIGEITCDAGEYQQDLLVRMQQRRDVAAQPRGREELVAIECGRVARGCAGGAHSLSLLRPSTNERNTPLAPSSRYSDLMTPLKIRFKPGLAIAFLVVGLFLAATSLLTSQVIGVVSGALVAVLGVLMFVNPMMKVEATEVQVRNLLGMTLRRFAVSSPADLRFDGNALWHVPQNTKIGSFSFGANKEDQQALRAQIEGY